MNPTITGIIVFSCTFAGALVGMKLRGVLPEHHLEAESRETVKLGIGLVATMTALVLGLVTANAKSSFDAADTALKETTIELLTLDRLLARYGPETAEIRGRLTRAIGERLESIWPQGSSTANLDSIRSGGAREFEEIAAAIGDLAPRDDAQSEIRSRALDLSEVLLQTRWRALAGVQPSVPAPFLLILLFWLTITFGSFGLFAPRNTTVLCVLLVCALSVGGAVFLVLEMDGPFEGLLKVSAEPLRRALQLLNR